MSLWRFTRDEMTGAWRSLRYDLSRRADERGWHVGPAATPGDPTGTTRSPRLVAAAAFAIVAVGGSAGSYLAVVNGVGSLLDEPTGPEPYPLVAEAAPQVALPTPSLLARPGGRAAVAPGRVTVVTVTVTPTAAATTTTAAVTAAARRPPAAGVTTPPVRLPGTPTRPGSPPRVVPPPSPCDCPNPPVPTPTSPPSPSPSPSVTPSGDPSPTSEPSDPVTTTPGSDAPSSPAATDGDESGGPDDDRERNREDRHFH